MFNNEKLRPPPLRERVVLNIKKMPLISKETPRSIHIFLITEKCKQILSLKTILVLPFITQIVFPLSECPNQRVHPLVSRVHGDPQLPKEEVPTVSEVAGNILPPLPIEKFCLFPTNL